GLKYFVLGALASGMLLYGISLVYGFAGTTSFGGLAQLFAGGGKPSSGLIIGLVFVSVGLAFKISAVPFHMWTPDVYEGAPTPVSAFFSVAPKIATMALFVRFLVEPFGGLVAEWRQVIVFLSVEEIADLSGLGRTQPGLALAFGIFMFALAGIPPTAGFFPKLYVFLAAIDAHLVGLAVIGVLASVVGAFYYLRIVKVMYFDEPVGSFDRPIAPELKWVLFVAAVLTMFFILLPDPIVGSAGEAAA